MPLVTSICLLAAIGWSLTAVACSVFDAERAAIAVFLAVKWLLFAMILRRRC